MAVPADRAEPVLAVIAGAGWLLRRRPAERPAPEAAAPGGLGGEPVAEEDR